MTPDLRPASAQTVYYSALDAWFAAHPEAFVKQAGGTHDLIPAGELAALRADRDLWRQRVMDTRELIDLVEAFAADPTPTTGGELITYYRAWRGLVEAGIPVTWAEPAPAVLAEAEVPV